VAQENPGVGLVDAARELGSDPGSTGEITGRELLLEHVHPDWIGNYRIARLLAGGVEQALDPLAPGRGPWLDLTPTAAAVGCTLVERAGLLQRAALITREPPFPNQLTYAEDQMRLGREITDAIIARRDPASLRLAREILGRAIAADPDNPDLAKLAVELADDSGDLPGALAEVRRAQALQPSNFALFADEAIKLERLGREAEAEKLLLATAAACNARDLAKLTPAIADFYTRTKRLAEGRAWFAAARLRHPDSLPFRFFGARLAQAAGDTDAAEQDYRAILAADPANEAALEALAALLVAGGKSQEAGDLCVAHAATQRQNQANHLRVAQILEARGRPAAAAEALRAATRSGPVPVPVHLRFANLLYQQQRRTEALDELATTWRLAQAENDPETAASIRTLIVRIQAEAR
jgi:predicted Zn-dependent protease